MNTYMRNSTIALPILELNCHNKYMFYNKYGFRNDIEEVTRLTVLCSKNVT